jgi:hypothetical protein
MTGQPEYPGELVFGIFGPAWPDRSVQLDSAWPALPDPGQALLELQFGVIHFQCSAGGGSAAALQPRVGEPLAATAVAAAHKGQRTGRAPPAVEGGAAGAGAGRGGAGRRGSGGARALERGTRRRAEDSEEGGGAGEALCAAGAWAQAATVRSSRERVSCGARARVCAG